MSRSVWYVSKYVVVPGPGDPPSRPFALTREFSRLGIETVVVTSDSMGLHNVPKVQGRFRLENYDDVKLCRIRTSKYERSVSVRRLMSWLTFEFGLWFLPFDRLIKPDVVVVSCPSPITILNGLRLKRRYKCRLIYEVRDIWPLSLLEFGNSGIKKFPKALVGDSSPFRWLLAHIERLGYEKADAVVGLMPNLVEHVREVSSSTKRVECIPMGVDLSLVNKEDTHQVARFRDALPQGKFIVGYAGSLGLANAMETFFECARSLTDQPDIHFAVLGDGQYREKFEEEFGCQSNISFLGHAPRRDVQAFLGRCDLLYLATRPSALWRFGFSLNKLIDYMVAAKPIVMSYSGFQSMIDEADCGSFIEPSNPTALRAEILKYSEMNPDDRNEIGAHGRAWLLENRDYRVLAKEYLRILFPGQ